MCILLFSNFLHRVVQVKSLFEKPTYGIYHVSFIWFSKMSEHIVLHSQVKKVINFSFLLRIFFLICKNINTKLSKYMHVSLITLRTLRHYFYVLYLRKFMLLRELGGMLQCFYNMLFAKWQGTRFHGFWVRSKMSQKWYLGGQ